MMFVGDNGVRYAMDWNRWIEIKRPRIDKLSRTAALREWRSLAKQVTAKGGVSYREELTLFMLAQRIKEAPRTPVRDWLVSRWNAIRKGKQ